MSTEAGPKDKMDLKMPCIQNPVKNEIEMKGRLLLQKKLKLHVKHEFSLFYNSPNARPEKNCFVVSENSEKVR